MHPALRVALGTLGYLVVVFPLAAVQHVVLFPDFYLRAQYLPENPSFPLGALAIIAQGFAVSASLVLLKPSKRHAVALIGAFALAHWAIHVIAAAAKGDVLLLHLFIPLETLYLIVQWGVVGALAVRFLIPRNDS